LAEALLSAARAQHADLEPLLVEAARVAGEARDARLEAKAYLGLASTLSAAGKHDQAALVIALAESAVARAGDDRTRADLLRWRAQVQRERGDPAAAEASLQAALAIVERQPDDNDERLAQTYKDLAAVAGDRAHYTDAHRWFE